MLIIKILFTTSDLLTPWIKELMCDICRSTTTW